MLLLQTEHRWSLVAAAVYTGLVLLALGLQWTVGDRWWNQLVNLTTLWWLLPSIPLLALALMTRRTAAAVLLGIPVLALVVFYGGLYLGSWGAQAGTGDLTVAAYNVWMRTDDVAHVADLVAEQEVDLLLLSEVTGRHVAALRSELGEMLPHAWYGRPRRFGGVGVLSRHPVLEVRPVAGADAFERPTAVVLVGVPGPDGRVQPVQVVPLHLIAMCPVCGPFVARQRHEVDSRRTEVAAVLEALDDDLPAIVGGDLNGERRSAAYRSLRAAGFSDPHAAVGTGLGLTYPGDHGTPSGVEPPGAPLAHLPLVSFPVLRLDHVLVRGLDPVRAGVGPSRASDHRPVVVELDLP